jgi:lipid A ethanolaminephosphotransferase
MFADEDSHDFDVDDAYAQENLLDVLHHAGVAVLWRDNNSDSKGVAVGDGVRFEDFRTAEHNSVCDSECRDIGMLDGLDTYIAGEKSQDIVIVLHQMGNHGPAYYKRYPQEFERFTPTCQTNQLEKCTEQEINNAYDNAVAYTDHFLASVIDFLEQYDEDFETAMFYVSDHGESLGESGLYLHGLPKFMAPEEQTQVASLMWFGKAFEVDPNKMRELSSTAVSHDNVFHTVLGLLELQTDVYQEQLDMVHPAKVNQLACLNCESEKHI